MDPLNTWMKSIRPYQDPAYKKPTMSTKTGVARILINNFIPHPNLLSQTEGFPIVGASFIEIKFSDPPVLKPQTQTHSLSPFHRDPQSFSLPFQRGDLYITLKR